LGYGNGSFQSPISYSTGSSSEPYSVAIADFDNDSELDIAVANYNSNNVWVFLGYGDGSFRGQMVYSMTDQSNPIWVAVNDLNDDTIPDIVVANHYADNVCILFGFGNGSFGNVITLSTGLNSGPRSIALGDLNQDKSIDIAVANLNSNSVGVFFGYGNGTFFPQKIYPVDPGAVLHSIIVSDINNDTLLDILVADYNEINSSIGIFYGFGDGNFTLPKIYSTGLNSQPYVIATGDFNNDSKVDLAINYFNQDIIGVFIQVKSESFASSTLFSTGNESNPKAVALGDFNNDNHLDIAVANSATNNIGILLGYGNGDFANQLTYSTGTNSLPSSIAVGHFNDDLYLDIAVINAASNTVGILLGYGNGRFANMTIYSTGISSDPVSIAVNDLNKDNYLDLVVANWGSNDVWVFLGMGNGTFFKPTVYSIGYNARPQSVAIGDINNDDMLDIVVANYGTNYVEILLQTC
jgi:predicted nucleotidyltransferase